MRKYFIPIMAIIVAIILSSFTRSTTIVYFVYSGSGHHNWRGSYDQTVFTQPWIPGTNVLAWFSIEDDNGTITNAEFDAAFNTLNSWAPVFNTLDDDPEVWTGQYRLEKKFN